MGRGGSAVAGARPNGRMGEEMGERSAGSRRSGAPDSVGHRERSEPFLTLLAGGDPAHQQQGALGVETGGLGPEAVVQALAG